MLLYLLAIYFVIAALIGIVALADWSDAPSAEAERHYARRVFFAPVWLPAGIIVVIMWFFKSFMILWRDAAFFKGTE